MVRYCKHSFLLFLCSFSFLFTACGMIYNPSEKKDISLGSIQLNKASTCALNSVNKLGFSPYSMPGQQSNSNVINASRTDSGLTYGLFTPILYMDVVLDEADKNMSVKIKSLGGFIPESSNGMNKILDEFQANFRQCVKTNSDVNADVKSNVKNVIKTIEVEKEKAPVVGNKQSKTSQDSVLIISKQYLRAKPNFHSKIITEVEPGEGVHLLKKSGHWRKVKSGSGEIGWVHETMIEYSK